MQAFRTCSLKRERRAGPQGQLYQLISMNGAGGVIDFFPHQSSQASDVSRSAQACHSEIILPPYCIHWHKRALLPGIGRRFFAIGTGSRFLQHQPQSVSPYLENIPADPSVGLISTTFGPLSTTSPKFLGCIAPSAMSARCPELLGDHMNSLSYSSTTSSMTRFINWSYPFNIPVTAHISSPSPVPHQGPKQDSPSRPPMNLTFNRLSTYCARLNILSLFFFSPPSLPPPAPP